MKHCDKCTDPIPTWTEIDGKRINAQRRRFCFKCSPYKGGNRRDLTAPKPDPKLRESNPAAVKLWRQRFKNRIVMALGGKCQCCGYDRCFNALETHHLDPSVKEMSFGGIKGHPRAWAVVITELRKCILLCCLCHREVHAGVRTIPETAQRFDERWVDYKTMEKLAADHGLAP